MMLNKRTIAVLLFSALFLTLFSSSVVSQEQDITDSLYKSVSSVFGFMDQIEIRLIGETGDAAAKATFWARFLIWILVFTLSYYVFRMFFPGNIAGTVAFVLALISVLGIPGTLLRDIIINYSIIATLVLLGAPIAGLLLFRFKMKSQHGGTVWAHIAFVLFDVFIIILISRFIIGLNALAAASPSAGSVSSWAYLLIVVMVIILVLDFLDIIRSVRGSYQQPYMPTWMPGAAGVHELSERAERASTDAERLAAIGTQLGTMQQELEGVNARIEAGEISLASERLALQQRINRVLRDLENLQRGL